VTESEEEIYSTMFTSLKHPARRKILRMLSEKPMTFSRMLEDLGVSSSHLTYHLESLGELVSKEKDGTYKLSTFGEASVDTMRIVEETPAVQSKQRPSLSLKWKSVLALLAMGMLILDSVSYLQYSSVNRLATEHDELQLKYEQLLSWSAGANRAISFLRDVVQIDVEKYQATLLGDTVEQRANLGGVVEQILRYSLSSSESKLDVVFRFRNNRLSMYQIILLEGEPIYAEPQPFDIVDSAEGLLQRLIISDGAATYLEDMRGMLSSVNVTQNFELTVGNTKLNVSLLEREGEILWMYTENGVDFSPKSLSLVYENGVLKQLVDGWFLLKVGSTTVQISREEAIETAREYIESFSYTVDGTQVSGFTVLNEPVSVVFHPTPREEPLALIPYWYVTLYLDRVYPGGVNRIAVGLWADTGQIERVKTLSG
jgi:DNA-binding transcriptional ArsR family regulator